MRFSIRCNRVYIRVTRFYCICELKDILYFSIGTNKLFIAIFGRRINTFLATFIGTFLNLMFRKRILILIIIQEITIHLINYKTSIVAVSDFSMKQFIVSVLKMEIAPAS